MGGSQNGYLPLFYQKGFDVIYQNGRIPLDALTVIYGNHRLQPDAADAFIRLSSAFYAEFGYGIVITDAYRTYDEQVAVKKDKPTLATTPGKSEHGWGLALDLASMINVHTSAQHKWMDENAHRFGWVNPVWAQKSKFEPWHWEYAAMLDQGKGTVLTARPTMMLTIKPIEEEDMPFRIRVDAATGGVKNADAHTVFLCNFGPPGVACFMPLNPDQNTYADRAGIEQRKLPDGSSLRDYSQYEKDKMREAIITTAQSWGIK